jgi:arylsulfatase A-like enzyme
MARSRPKTGFGAGLLGYHLALWVSNLAIFLVLDFAKRADDLLYGLSLPELATNAGVVALFSWPLGLLLALLTLGMERAGALRAAHALAAFAFLSVQLWSLKVGLASVLQAYPGPTRTRMAALAFVVVLAASLALARRLPRRWSGLQDRAGAILGGWAVLTALGLLAGLAGQTSPPQGPGSPPQGPGGKPNVILVTMDALSAQRTSVYGYGRQTTPNLARLASESIVFERMHSNFNVTGLALPSFNGYLSAAPQGPTLAASLAQAGYPHRAFFSFWAPELFFLHDFTDSALTRRAMLGSTYAALRRLFSERQLRWWAGLGSEESQYYNPYTPRYHDDIFWQKLHYPPQVSLQEGLNDLRAHPSGAFVWIHLWPPHFPYVPDEDVKGMFGPVPDDLIPFVNAAYAPDMDDYVERMGNLYDAGVYSVDRQLGVFLEALKREGLYDSSLLIVAADHGESFERGYVGHSGWPVMEPITHIPFLIHRPGEKAGIRVATLAQQLDIAPTILDLLGLPIPSSMHGESLLPYIEDPKRLSQRYKVSISLLASSGEGGQVAVYWKTFKLMFLSNDRSVYRLYDLFADPEAGKDIAAQHPELVSEMMSRMGDKPAGH